MIAFYFVKKKPTLPKPSTTNWKSPSVHLLANMEIASSKNQTSISFSTRVYCFVDSAKLGLPGTQPQSLLWYSSERLPDELWIQDRRIKQTLEIMLPVNLPGEIRQVLPLLTFLRRYAQLQESVSRHRFDQALTMLTFARQA